jgi:hypothetical protein
MRTEGVLLPAAAVAFMVVVTLSFYRKEDEKGAPAPRAHDQPGAFASTPAHLLWCSSWLYRWIADV